MKDKFFSELTACFSKNKKHYLVGGDFNIIRFFVAKNENFHPNRFSDTFNAIIQVNALREIPIAGVCTHGLITSLILLLKS
jgi:hypothetical protein